VKVLQDTVGNTTFSHVKICAPEEPAERKGIVIICVLDISGSMDIEATQGAYN
jgi:Mg-chelatase subunit ChlD